MLILPPPATPTTTAAVPGPPPPPSNDTDQPLPPMPNPALGTQQFGLDFGALQGQGVFPSIPLPSNLLGISIELSVANEFLGDAVKVPPIPFMNFLEAVGLRAGRGPLLRIGGNTQDTSRYDRSFNGVITKEGGGHTPSGVPITPDIIYSRNIMRVIADVVRLIQAEVIWGINMGNASHANNDEMLSDIVEELGEHVSFLLVGNEPDRYVGVGKRPQGWDIPQYLDEWADVTDAAIKNHFQRNPKQFVAPSVCCQWTTKQVLDAGMSDRFKDRMKAISAIKYPESMCSSSPPRGHATFLSQAKIVGFATYDVDAVGLAVATGIPYLLTETNTASCVGLPGVSNSFTAALWGVNAGMQLAYRNHSGVLWHNGGRSVLYNVFTPPAKNATTKSWITGPIFYSLLVVAEALRPKVVGAEVRVVDFAIKNDALGVYGVLENGQPSKIVAVNMANDPSGANDAKVVVPQLDGASTVSVKKMLAPSVNEKANITWAGQTFGYWSNGILTGEENIEEAACGGGTCTVTVPAPGAALIFLRSPTKTEVTVATSTYSALGTANPSIVVYSNGGRGQRGGASSRGSVRTSSARRGAVPPVVGQAQSGGSWWRGWLTTITGALLAFLSFFLL